MGNLSYIILALYQAKIRLFMQFVSTAVFCISTIFLILQLLINNEKTCIDIVFSKLRKCSYYICKDYTLQETKVPITV